MDAIQKLNDLAQSLQAAKRVSEATKVQGKGPKDRVGGSAPAPTREAAKSPLEYLGQNVNILA